MFKFPDTWNPRPVVAPDPRPRRNIGNRILAAQPFLARRRRSRTPYRRAVSFLYRSAAAGSLGSKYRRNAVACPCMGPILLTWNISRRNTPERPFTSAGRSLPVLSAR